MSLFSKEPDSLVKYGASIRVKNQDEEVNEESKYTVCLGTWLLARAIRRLPPSWRVGVGITAEMVKSNDGFWMLADDFSKSVKTIEQLFNICDPYFKDTVTNVILEDEDEVVNSWHIVWDTDSGSLTDEEEICDHIAAARLEKEYANRPI